MAKVPFLGLDPAPVTGSELTAWICRRAQEAQCPTRIGYLNAAMVNLAFETPEFASAIKQFDCLYADGMSIVWAAKRFGGELPERVNAGDFTESFLRAFAEAGLRVALIGGREGEAKRFAENFAGRIAGLEFVFARHGYFGDDESGEVISEIEAADPDIVLLGMGAPKQERLAVKWSAEGRPRVWWCVGALFEYSSGARARAPVWVRRVGMEWLFRLALEPRRLWSRYIIGNPKFIWRVLRGKPVGD